MKLKALLIICLLASIRCAAQVQPFANALNFPGLKIDSTVIKKLNSRLAGFLTGHQTEKAYLQFDKSYYMAGDTLYFKGYITLGEYHELSNLSGVLHVDFISPANKIVKNIKLQLVNGMAWGDFALADTLSKGQYRVRAYTQWMQNEGEAAFFEQIIPIVSLKNTPVAAENKPAAQKPDMQFFPEGGSLVQGVRSKVAFKAINANGMGTDVKGVIVDNDNKEVLSFASSHLGMGYFNLDVAEGKSYKAKVVYPDGTQDVIALPMPAANGITLSVDAPAQLTTITLRANKAYFAQNKDKFYTILVYGGGAATTVAVQLQSETVKIAVDKQQFPTGIAKVAVFSPVGEPVNERLFFIQNNDQLKLNIKSDKTQYAKRENTTINLNVSDKDNKPVEGNFSVSVIDQSKVTPVGENAGGNILSNLLLTSDLTGNIERPAYYFDPDNYRDPSNQTYNELDLVMLTHGYRRFEWKKILNEGYSPNKYQAETNIDITGSVTASGSLLPNYPIIVSYRDNGQFFTKDTVTDSKGNFKFSQLQFANNTRFLLKAKGGDKITISYNIERPLLVNKSKSLLDTAAFAYLANNSNLLYTGSTAIKKMENRTLNDVNVRDTKINANDPVENIKMVGNKVYYGKDLVQSGRLTNALNQAGAGIDFKKTNQNSKKGIGKDVIQNVDFDSFLPGGKEPALLIVDGIEYMGNIDDFSVDIISSVEILGVRSQSKKFYGALSRAEGGVIVINTDRNKGGSRDKIEGGGTLYIEPQGFYTARQFYVPKYGSEVAAQTKKDMRSTIYWQPQLITDKNGNASFNYPNADGTGNYLVVIEGIDNSGNLGSMRYTYKVQ